MARLVSVICEQVNAVRHVIQVVTQKWSRVSWPARVTLLLMTVAFGSAAWGSMAIFDRLPHVEDEVAYLFQAKSIAEGTIIAPAPEHPEFFRIPFVIIQDGLWFGKYPLGYPAVLALGVLAGKAWIVNAIAAALCVGLVGLIGRRAYGGWTGALAGALLVTSPFFLLQSSSLMPHVTGLLWALLALGLFLLVRRDRSLFAAAGLGAVMGVLFISRPLTAVGIGLPLVLILGWDLLKDRRWRPVLGSAAAFLPFLGIYLLYNHLTTGDPLRSAYELWWPYDRIGFGDDVGRTGHSPEEALRFARLNLNSLYGILFGWPGRWSIAPFALAAGLAAGELARAVVRRKNQLRDLSPATKLDLLLVATAISLVGAYMLYWTPGQMYGPRYYFEAMGALALLSARGIMHLYRALDWLLAQRIELRGLAQSPALLLCGVLLTAMTTYSLVVTTPDRIEAFRGWNGIDRSDVERIDESQLHDALVFVPRESWTDYAPFFVRNSPHLDDNVIYAAYRDHLRSLELMRAYPDREIYIYQDGELRRLRKAS